MFFVANIIIFVQSRMSKSNKYSLLDKKQKEKYSEKEEWIQMENLTLADHKGNYQDSQESEVKYQKFKEQEISIQPTNYNKKIQPSGKTNQNQQIPPQTQKNPSYQQSSYPQNYNNQNTQANKRPANQSSYNPYENVRNKQVNSSNINVNNQSQMNRNMNSRHPQQNRSQIPQNNKPNIPPMTVNCQKCTFSQSVPGNCQVYICCMCNQMSECFPLYGIFVCGVCQINVVYPFGTSQFVKCTRCQTINRVPFEPKKSYKSSINQKSKESQQIPNSSSGMRRNEYDQEVNIKVKVEQKKQLPFQKDQKRSQNETLEKQKKVEIKPQGKRQNNKQEEQYVFKQKQVSAQKEERLLDLDDNLKTFKVQEDIFNQNHNVKVKQEILFDESGFNLNEDESIDSRKNGYPTFFD